MRATLEEKVQVPLSSSTPPTEHKPALGLFPGSFSTANLRPGVLGVAAGGCSEPGLYRLVWEQRSWGRMGREQVRS